MSFLVVGVASCGMGMGAPWTLSLLQLPATTFDSRVATSGSESSPPMGNLNSLKGLRQTILLRHTRERSKDWN